LELGAVQLRAGVQTTTKKENIMWKLKTFKTKEAMKTWVENHKKRCQIVEVFINNGYAVEYRKLFKAY